MADTDNSLLDLSSWPSVPPAAAGPRPGLPPRPVRRRAGLPVRLSLRTAALVALVLGLVLLALPLGDCGPTVHAWGAAKRPLPSAVPPGLDDRVVQADEESVAAAQQALARPSTGPATQPATSARPVASASSRTVATHTVDQAAVRSAQSEVTRAQKDRDAAARDRDAALARQEAASDPGAYDDDVAAAQERLDQAESRLAEAKRDLATAKRGTTSTRVERVPVLAPARPTPAAASTVAPTADAQAQLLEAKRVQAAHLAERKAALGSWTLQHQQDVAQVARANAHAASCRQRAVVPGVGGAGALVAAAGLGALAWRRRQG